MDENTSDSPAPKADTTPTVPMPTETALADTAIESPVTQSEPASPDVSSATEPPATPLPSTDDANVIDGQVPPSPVSEQGGETVAPLPPAIPYSSDAVLHEAPTPTTAPAPVEATPVAPSSVGSGEATAPAPTPVKTEAEVTAPVPTLESEIQRSSVDAILHALSPAQLKAIVKKYLYARSIEGRASRDAHLLERKKLIITLIGERKRITRKEVMKLVGISRTGAKRYLNLLEKEGKIVQHGKIGPKVYYTLP